MKVVTPQILWNSEDASKGLPAALMGVSLIESGVTVQDAAGRATTPTYCLVTAGNTNHIHLWKVEFLSAPLVLLLEQQPQPPKNANDDETMSSVAVSPTTAAAALNCGGGGSMFQKDETGTTKIDFSCVLSRHEGPVNTVQFSPNGLHLATAGDTGSIIVWSVPVNKRANSNGKHYWSTVSKEGDLQVKIAARAMDGVTDISWSADSKRFVCGTIDHCIMVLEDASYGSSVASEWRVVYRNSLHHVHYVQGVAYDPSNVYLASQSSDRTVRVLSRKLQQKKKVLRPSNSSSGSLPPADHAAAVQQLLTDSKLELSVKAKQLKYRKNKDNDDTSAAAEAESETVTALVAVSSTAAKQYLYAAETTLESFVRRLAWTPDGAYLITPAAVWASELASNNNKACYATLLYQRHRFEEPWKVLGGLEKPSVAVRPNPVLFQLHTAGSTPTTATAKVDDTKENCSGKQQQSPLPYRSIFAVLTWDSVLLYDTVHDQPLSVARGLHYANLVDATWTPDGRNLLVCSTDGYISILRYAKGELGEVYIAPPIVEQQAAVKQKLEATLLPGAAKATKLLSVPDAPSLPPCEPGTATFECPPAKRAKTQIVPVVTKELDHHNKRTASEAVSAVEKLSLTEEDEGTLPVKKKKKRIQPTHISVT